MVSNKNILHGIVDGNIKVNFKTKTTIHDKIDALSLGLTQVLSQLFKTKVENQDDVAKLINEIKSGLISDKDIDPQIIKAFQLQYPNEESFVENIKEFASDPEKLMGFLNGVKGKLYELITVDHLNNGQLPEDQYARLAEKTNQEGWDVEIINENTNEIIQKIQVKATDHVEYIEKTLQKYPDIEIITTSEIIDKSTNIDFVGRVSGIGVSDASLEAELNESVDSILGKNQTSDLSLDSDEIFDNEVSLSFGFPIYSLGIILLTESPLLIGENKNKQATNRAIERVTKTIISNQLGHFVFYFTGEPISTFIVTVGTRLMFGKVNFEKKKIDFYDFAIIKSQLMSEELKIRNKKMNKLVDDYKKNKLKD